MGCGGGTAFKNDQIENMSFDPVQLSQQLFPQSRDFTIIDKDGRVLKSNLLHFLSYSNPILQIIGSATIEEEQEDARKKRKETDLRLLMKCLRRAKPKSRNSPTRLEN